MAGANKTLKEGQLLFKAGDQSDGMYLVRKGELRVFLEQNGKEVMLASVGAGGMIGEMALFDNSPRSASVKAVTDCEVTQISTDDFAKLMKQIPKWFVSLMVALSSRLRTTNERLRKLETVAAGAANTQSGKPFQSVLRQLNVLILLWAKDGVREGKEITLAKSLVEKQLAEGFGEDPEKTKLMFEVLTKQKLITTRIDKYKNAVLIATNRTLLTALPEFIQGFLKISGGKPCLPDSGIGLLQVLERMVLKSPYDSITISLADLEKEGARDGLPTAEWSSSLDLLKSAGDEVKIVKSSGGPGLKTNKKDVSNFTRLHEILAALFKANLA